ncbi:mandelate racemase/muconate lactonizing enzyme family protein [Thermodesulfobacteriota bacterium]
MKITDVQAFPLLIPMEEEQPLAPMGETSAHHTLIKVFTDEDIIGLGEAFRFAPGAMCTFIDEVLKPLIIKQDPLEIEKLWHLMYNTTFRYGRKGLVLHAISGVEIALCDILGKYRNLPVYEILGGTCREEVRAYASLHKYDRPEDVAEIARRCVEQGYTAIKLHQRDITSVHAAREAIGDGIDLMMDASGAWSPREALDMAMKLEEYGLLWLEEPLLRMDDYTGLAWLRNKSGVAIAAGENEYTVGGFREMLIAGAVDIVQPDAIKSGGIFQCKKIFALAEAFNVQATTHSFYYGPGLAATLQLCFNNGVSPFIEINALPLKKSFIHPDLRPENGYFKALDGPGLGITLDEDVVEEYKSR